MKSTLLKTLAATSLVATTQAEVHVLGASFKERGVNAPLGTIITNPGTVSATRGYLIMDHTISGATPGKAAYIEYGEIRNAGVITRYYTVDTDFDDFRADAISGDTGGRRIYGHMHAPVLVADVPDALIPFSGTVGGQYSFPKKLSFDQTVFQTGASDSVAGPQIIVANDVASTLRSVVSGSANPVKVSATTIFGTGPNDTGAVGELIARLERQGYVKTLGEAPEITSTFPATVPLADGATQVLTVTLDPDTNPATGDEFAAPTYQWYKNDVVIAGAVLPSFTLTGGAASETSTGAGSYKVVVTNALGSAISTNVVVTSVANEIVTNLQATTIEGSNSAVLSVGLKDIGGTAPAYKWYKAPTATPTAFVAIPESNTPESGTGATLTVTGGSAVTGAGVYKVEITNSVGMISSASAVVTVNPVAMSFTTNLNATQQVPFAESRVLAPVPVANALPKITTYQWMKAPLATPTAFVNVATQDGGQGTTLTVYGDGSKPTGPGVYRLTIGNGTTTINSAVCTVTATP